MIQMLSAFDLPPDTNLTAFAAQYARFVKGLRDADLIVGASGIGNRCMDTPMDTDATNPHRFITLLHFANRAQLDAAYAKLSQDLTTHHGIHRAISNGTFTCWELPDD